MINRYLPNPTSRSRTPRRPLERRGADRRRLRPEQAARCARVQARGRALRPAHLRARLPGHAQEGHDDRQQPHQEEATRSAASCGCTPTRCRTSTTASAGDIVALFGIECASGDTFTDGTHIVSMSSMHVPRSGDLAVRQADRHQGAGQHGQGAGPLRARGSDLPQRFVDKTRAVRPMISGMGELHLEVYVERMKREYSLRGRDRRPAGGVPRDDLADAAEFHYTHKKQTGGSGQFGGREWAASSPSPRATQISSSSTRSAVARSPPSSSRRWRKGFAQLHGQGPLIGFPVQGMRVVLTDGKSHSVDSSDNAFQAAGRGCLPLGLRRRPSPSSSSRS